MQDALFETPLYRDFADLSQGKRIPDQVCMLRFRHLFEEHQLNVQILATVNSTLAANSLLLKNGTAINTTLITAPSSTKNSSCKHDPEMHQTMKDNQWHFKTKAHIVVDIDSGLVQTVVGTAANINDLTQAGELVRGEDSDVFAEAG